MTTRQAFALISRGAYWPSEVVENIKTFVYWFVKGYKLNLKPQSTQK